MSVGRIVRTLVGVVLISALGACRSSPSAPSPASIAGEWSGTTAQGAPIAFRISSDERVTSITVGYNFNGCTGSQTFSNLSLQTKPNVECLEPGPCGIIQSYRGIGYTSGPSSDGSTTWIQGVFLSQSHAEGTAGFSNYPGCGTAMPVAWAANRR